MTGTQRESADADRDKVCSHIGQQLHRLRRERRVSMRAVADGTGLSTAFVCQIENGRSMPSAYTLWRLTDFFGVTFDHFTKGLEL